MKLADCTNVYFACTGNTCRSPMAESLLRSKLAQRGIEGIVIDSRRSLISRVPTTTSTPPSTSTPTTSNDSATSTSSKNTHHQKTYTQKISLEAENLIRSRLGDNEFVESHTPSSFTMEDLEDADIVIVMDRKHQEDLSAHIAAFNPGKELKVYTFGDLVGDPDLKVKDPMTAGGASTSYASWAQVPDFPDDFDFGDNWDDEYFDTGDVTITHSPTGTEVSATKTPKRSDPPSNGPPKETSSKKKADVYAQTFDQLDTLIEQILDTEITFTSMDEVFSAQLTAEYNRWLSPPSYGKTSAFGRSTKKDNKSQQGQQKGKPQKKAAKIVTKLTNLLLPPITETAPSSSTYTSSKFSARAQYNDGKYSQAAKKIHTDITNALRDCEDLARLYRTAAQYGESLKEEETAFDSALREQIFPRLLRADPEFFDSEWKLDKNAAGSMLCDVMTATAYKIPEIIQQGGRDEAFAAYRLGLSLFSLSKRLLPKKDTIAVYDALRTK